MSRLKALSQSEFELLYKTVPLVTLSKELNIDVVPLWKRAKKYKLGPKTMGRPKKTTFDESFIKKYPPKITELLIKALICDGFSDEQLKEKGYPSDYIVKMREKYDNGFIANKQWKNIKNFNNYRVSEYGDVVKIINDTDTNKLYALKPNEANEVCLRASNKTKRVQIAKLVAQHFIPNPNGFKSVIHKDGNLLNNHYTNLEWTEKNYRNSCAVYCKELDKTFDSVLQAGFELHLKRRCISQAYDLGISYKGYTFKLNRKRKLIYIANYDVRDLFNEEWRDIQGTDKQLKISNYGRIKSVGKHTKKKNIEERIVRQIVHNKKSMIRTKIYKNNGLKRTFIVIEEVVKAFPEKFNGSYSQAYNIDGNPLNCAISNIGIKCLPAVIG